MIKTENHIQIYDLKDSFLFLTWPLLLGVIFIWNI